MGGPFVSFLFLLVINITTTTDPMKNTFVITFLLTLIVSINVHAQQDPQYTHNMFDRLSVNPASSGMNGSYCATTILRQQWASFDGAPKTGLLNLQGPSETLHGGLGLTLFKDALGQENNTMVRLSYAYHFQLNNGGKLGIGIAGGIFNKRLGADWRPINPTDPVINPAVLSSTIVNSSAGIYYSRPGQMYVGLSSTNITQGTFKNQSIQSARHYYVMGGYSWNVPGMPQLELQPSFLAKTDVASMQVDLNCIALWNGRIYTGLTYRHKDAIAPLVGIMFQVKTNHWLRAGYAYDITTSGLSTVSSGSHEVMLSYCFKIKKGSTHYRDVRNMGTSPFMIQ